MTEVNTSDVTGRVMQVVAVLFIMVMLALTIGREALNEYAPEKRAEQIEYATKNYSFLKGPSKAFDDRYDDRKRRVVFINSENNPIGKRDGEHLESQSLAVLYAAKVEAKVGRQEWLDKAYQSYALTREEFTRLKGLEEAYDEKQNYQALESPRSLEGSYASNENSQKLIREGLLQRDLLAKL